MGYIGINLLCARDLIIRSILRRRGPPLFFDK